jgi:hypothetical protein
VVEFHRNFCQDRFSACGLQCATEDN